MEKCSVILFFFFALTSQVIAEETYILFDVKVEDHRNDAPVWLAVEGKAGIQHWRIAGHIFKVKPGEYWIDHIDFHKMVKFRHGSLDVSEKSPINFTVRSGYINFLGALKVQKRRGSLSLKFSAESSLVDLACELNPKVFSEMEIVVVLLPESQETHRVECTS